MFSGNQTKSKFIFSTTSNDNTFSSIFFSPNFKLNFIFETQMLEVDFNLNGLYQSKT